MKLFRPSGGVRYHLRGALSRRLWRGFSGSLETWLEEWGVPRDRLILIGPSGGYTLPSKWLASFREISVYDIDPLAQTFFRRRHAKSGTRFVRTDVFWRDGGLTTAPLQTLLNQEDGAVLFCNVLGQLPLEGHMSDSSWQAFLNELRTLLTGRPWASYHDLYSVGPLPQALHVPIAHAFRETRDVRHALEIMGSGIHRIEVLDHMLLGAWCAGLPLEVFPWSLTRKRLHIIGGVRG